MANKHTTKKALLMSALSLLLCCSMLIGTTFAWFTDTVTSGTNQIIAGNLDVEVYYGDPAKKDTIQDVDTLFNGVTLWEPGAIAWENLTVVNEGTLALKYQLSVNFDNENTVNGYGLSTALKVAVVEGGFNGTREDALKLTYSDTLASFTESGALLPKDDSHIDAANVPAGAEKVSKTYGIVIYWEPGPNDDNWNVNNGKEVSDFAQTNKNELHIDLGIKLVATQLTAEDDSFGPDYDAGAPWMGGIDISWYTQNPDAQEFVLDSAEELAGLAAIVNGTADMMRSASTEIHDDFAGQTIKLGGDIDLDGNAWTPIGRIGKTSTDFTYAFKGTFDGQNHTISNLDVNAYGWAGVFGLAYEAQINNLKVDGVTITANRLAGAVVGQLYGSIDNCHVSNAQIMVTPNAVGDSYDNGDKVGGIVGWLGDNGNNRTLTNCSATDVELSAYRDVGGIAGYVAYSTKIANNKADKIDITVDQVSHFYGEKDPNAGAIWGRNSVSDSGVGVIDENNTKGEVAITSTISKDGITYIQDGVTGETTLYLVPADYAGSTVNVAEGTTTIGGYAFAYNSNIEKIVLPSTVTKLNDRAFRDTSASTVILNEGLTNISYQAFRNALNVTSVVIPSTVTTISKEAFQNSGITSLTIPATVTTVEYGACRDMKMVKTVTIEGNADIPLYAFRACTNLKTVVLKGDNVTFGGGSRGMIFTNKENGDGSAITIYVENDTVKERLLAADTAAKDYGGYKIVVGAVNESAESKSEVTNTVKDAIAAGETDIIIDVMGKDIGNLDYAFGNSSLIVPEGTTVTVKNAVISDQSYGNMVNGTIIFEDCSFNNADGAYSIHFADDHGNATGNGVVIFKNCYLAGWCSFGTGIKSVEFYGCTVEHNGHYGQLRFYQDAVLDNTVFDADVTVDTYTGDLVVNNCSVDDGSYITEVIFVDECFDSITIDGKKTVYTQAALEAAAAQNATVYLIGNDAGVVYDLNGIQHDGLTIIGLGNDVKMVNNTKYASGKAIGAIWQAINLENVTITNTVYTMADGGNATFTNVNFAAGFRQGYGTSVVFTDCTFGSNSEGYALHFQTDAADEGGLIKLNGCKFEGGKVHLGGKRAYEFTDCDFAAGTDFQVWSNITLDGCTVDGVKVTAENISALFPKLDIAKVTIK